MKSKKIPRYEPSIEEKTITREIYELLRITLDAQPEIRSYIRGEVIRIKSETEMGTLIECYQ